MSNIDEVKGEILNYLKDKSYNVFYGTVNFERIVYWNKPDDWVAFLKIAEKENVKTIIYYEHTFEEEITDLNKIIENTFSGKYEDPNAVEFLSQMRDYEGLSQQIAWLQIAWIKDGIVYLLQFSSPRYEQLQELSERIQESSALINQKEIQEKVQKELDEDKNRLDKLTQQIVIWAELNNLTKVKKSQVKMYLRENKIKVTWDDENILYEKVNMELEKKNMS